MGTGKEVEQPICLYLTHNFSQYFQLELIDEWRSPRYQGPLSFVKKNDTVEKRKLSLK